MPAIGEMQLPKMAGLEVKPGVWLIGEPTPVPGTNLMRALADCFGCLCVIELKLNFAADGKAE